MPHHSHRLHLHPLQLPRLPPLVSLRLLWAPPCDNPPPQHPRPLASVVAFLAVGTSPSLFAALLLHVPTLSFLASSLTTFAIVTPPLGAPASPSTTSPTSATCLIVLSYVTRVAMPTALTAFLAIAAPVAVLPRPPRLARLAHPVMLPPSPVLSPPPSLPPPLYHLVETPLAPTLVLSPNEARVLPCRAPIIPFTTPMAVHHWALVVVVPFVVVVVVVVVVVMLVEVVVAVVEAVVVVALPLPLPPLCTGLVVGRNGRWISSSTSRCPS